MRILVFQSRRLSYGSSWCFMEMFGRGMRQCGVSVKFFALGEDITGQERELRALTREHFDGIFDMNSRLVHVMLDERYYLDYFDAPFFHWIVDHPMHVHASLRIPLRQYRVICLDRYHKEYIERYYPHIEKVYVLAFAGIPASEFTGECTGAVPMRRREYDVLFPGTYMSSAYYKKQMIDISDFQCEAAERILSEYRLGSRKPIDELFAGEVSGRELFAIQMHHARLIDRYIRAWYRESVLNALLGAGIRVDVAGAHWEAFRPEAGGDLHIHPPCSYPDQLMMLEQSRMVLNVQPLFMDGVHDRVVNAMANRSVALTDHCEFIERNFVDGRDLVLFDRNDPQEAASQILELLHAEDRLEEIAASAHGQVDARHSWYACAEGFCSYLVAGTVPRP